VVYYVYVKPMLSTLTFEICNMFSPLDAASKKKDE